MFWLSLAAKCEWRARAVQRLFRSIRNANTPQTRGLRLLRFWLSPVQLAQFDSFGYFDVVGGTSGRTYRIEFGTCANILELDEDSTPKIGWCFVPSACLVVGDV